MSRKTNCPNCGAPYDPLLDRCPYCGTAYFDLSTIDFDSREPFYLKVKVRGHTITQLVTPDTAEFNTEVKYVECRGGLGNAAQWLLEREVENLTKLGFACTHRGEETFHQKNGGMKNGLFRNDCS